MKKYYSIRSSSFGRGMLATIRLSVILLFMPVKLLAQNILAQPETESLKPNSLSESARLAGISQCRNSIQQLANIAVRGSDSNDVLFDWRRDAPNNGPVFALMGIYQDKNREVSALSLSAVPEGKDGCNVSAERISVSNKSCIDIGRTEFADYVKTILLPQMTVYTNAKAPGSSVSLFDAQGGCLIIRRYVAFATH